MAGSDDKFPEHGSVHLPVGSSLSHLSQMVDTEAETKLFQVLEKRQIMRVRKQKIYHHGKYRTERSNVISVETHNRTVQPLLQPVVTELLCGGSVYTAPLRRIEWLQTAERKRFQQ